MALSQVGADSGPSMAIRYPLQRPLGIQAEVGAVGQLEASLPAVKGDDDGGVRPALSPPAVDEAVET